jgi:hypothetical protein
VPWSAWVFCRSPDWFQCSFCWCAGAYPALWYAASRRAQHDVILRLDDLPEATYRQPVVLVCGDLPLAWPQQSQVLTVTQGCWIRVEIIRI